VDLARSGPLKYIVSQNVDSLHRRSGVPANMLAEGAHDHQETLPVVLQAFQCACYAGQQQSRVLAIASGKPVSMLGWRAVHGNCFMERCPSCQTYYLRDFEMPTVGFQNTGRSCTHGRCRCVLKAAVKVAQLHVAMLD
jgi:NAD+-dependent protein deacetylase sirtuin 6